MKANKIELNGEVLLDLTQDTATPETVLEGVTFHMADGTPSTGTAKAGGGGSSVSPKDVNFYDYDGTLLHSYTVEEAQALTELPPLPTQEGLICQEWNWTLDDIKTHNRAVDVGATYITDDGKTRLYISITSDDRKEIRVRFNQSATNCAIVDWGDGSAPEKKDQINSVTFTHSYANVGDYVITISVADSRKITLGDGSTHNILAGSANFDSSGAVSNYLKKVELGTGVEIESGFKYCLSLKTITIPNSVTTVGTYCFSECGALVGVVFPKGVTSLGTYLFNKCFALSFCSLPNRITTIPNNAFYYCSGLPKITIPNGVTSLGSSAFSWIRGLITVVIPSSVTQIAKQAFDACYGVRVFDFTSHTSVPSLTGASAFTSSSDCEIRVPASLYDEWKNATNWASYASKIVAV